MGHRGIEATTRCKHKILLLGSQMAVGGAQRILLSQADWLAARGYPVTAVFLYDRDGLSESWQAGRPYPVINLCARQVGGKKWNNAFFLLRGLARLFYLMVREKFSAVETFTHHSNLIGCPIAWLARIPVRIASHHGRIEGTTGFLYRLHAWMVNLGIATSLVAVSREVLDQSIEEGVDPRRLVMIPNGIFLPEAGLSNAQTLRAQRIGVSNGPLLLAIGRLTFQKAHSVLLEAFPDVLTHFPDARIVILGEGPLRRELTKQAESLKIADRVFLAGVQADVSDWLLAADIFVLSSRWEGFPLVLLEAMCLGRPIVATDAQGVREALDDGACGLIVPIEDPSALANALVRVAGDGDLQQRLGKAAQARFHQEYTFDKMMAKYLDLLFPLGHNHSGIPDEQ